MSDSPERGHGFPGRIERTGVGRSPGGVDPQPASGGPDASVDGPSSEPSGEADVETESEGGGEVYLVGAGPGDPELLTRRAWNLLQRADAVLYDSLTRDRLIAEIPGETTAIDVGKRPPNPVSQAEIHDHLTERAGSGETVVRLKGGDPALFGRGGEEAEFLAEEGVPFEIVPGVSSLLAAPSVAGIPLTHRDHASSLTVVTGHETPDKAESALSWSAIAESLRAGGTLVVLMGVSNLPVYVESLREEGLAGQTPLALVQKATWAEERTLTTTLADAVTDARAADISPPAVTIVGSVVEIRERVERALEAE